MGATFSVLKSLTIPALIALVLYLLTTYLIVPLWLRHHARYTSYIPLPNISITSSFRQRLQSTLTRIILPSTWRAQTSHASTYRQEWDSESGEELEEVDEARRREALSLDARRGRTGNGDERLSRDLEEGFKDDSEDEEDAHSREVIRNLERMGMISTSR